MRKPTPPRVTREERLQRLVDSTLPRPAARMMVRADSMPMADVLAADVLKAIKQPGAGAPARQHMGRIAALECVLCARLHRRTHPVEVHHIRTGQGGAQRASDWLTLPLCPECHRGKHGIHGDQLLLRQAKVTELDLLADTLAILWRTA